MNRAVAQRRRVRGEEMAKGRPASSCDIRSVAIAVLPGHQPGILPLRSIGWRGEGRGEVRFGTVNFDHLGSH